MLRIWQSDPYSGSPLSQDGTLSAPLVFKLPPTGGVEVVQLWLRHDELSGEAIESSYGVVLESADDYGTDESSWLEIAPDVSGVAGTYASTLAVGDVLGGAIVPIWVRMTMPFTGEVGARSDIYLKLTSSSTPISQEIVLRTGTFLSTTYDADNDDVLFDTANAGGSWYSEWIDSSLMDDITYVDYSVLGTLIYVNYRASSAANDATATAWVGNADDLDPSLGYVQARVEFAPNSFIGQTGLTKTIYGGGNFNTYRTSTVGGTMPFTTTPTDSFPPISSARYTGCFNAVSPGNWTFRTQSNDGHRVYLDGDTISDGFSTTINNETIITTGVKNLTEGWHDFQADYFHASGSAPLLRMYVTPPGGVERAVQLTDFAPVEQTLKLQSMSLRYRGSKVYHYDTMIFDGPDVPILISPVDGSIERLFRPELTVSQENCEFVEFQFDNSNLFGSANLVTWVVATTPGELVVTNPPDGTRPSGVWYWRARGVLDGEYSAWSDWNFLTIEALVANPEFLYLNANIGVAVHDPIVDSRGLYLNVSLGRESHDPIVDARFIYLNVNIEMALGTVIYPMYDFTIPAKTDFEGDDEFITPEEGL